MSHLSCSVLLSSLRCKLRDYSRACGLILMSEDDALDFIKRYNQLHWLSADPHERELPLPDRCCLLPIVLDQDATQLTDFQKLIEFKPPHWMPAGNVGTPTSHFFSLIKTCQLDSLIIKKLKLDFSVFRRNRIYGAVPYDYDNVDTNDDSVTPGEVRSLTGTRILSSDEYAESAEFEAFTSFKPIASNYMEGEEGTKGVEGFSETTEPCEEWERFEALHDDPYKVERRDKANIKYEDKIELVWEKGGSGLVFHTDERTWRKLDPLRKEEIFDEPASLDWDIDMEVYENPMESTIGPSQAGHWGPSRDGDDLFDIQRTREPIVTPSTSGKLKSVFGVKSHVNNYGRRMMFRMGWKPGMQLGCGKSREQLSTVQSNGGLPPSLHPGLGYYGTRCARQLHASPVGQAAKRSVYIRSAFDSPSYVASRSCLGDAANLFCRDDPDQVMKYRSTDSVLPEGTKTNWTLDVAAKIKTVILFPHQSVSKEGITFVPGGILHPKRRNV